MIVLPSLPYEASQFVDALRPFFEHLARLSIEGEVVMTLELDRATYKAVDDDCHRRHGKKECNTILYYHMNTRTFITVYLKERMP